MELGRIEKILVINLGGIGDFLLSTPALRALKNHFKGARIYLLAVKRVADFAADLPYIEKSFVFEPSQPVLNAFSNFVSILALRRLKADLGINMRTLVSDEGARKMKFLLDAAGARVKAGRDTAGRGAFFDVKIPEDDIGQHYEMDYDCALVRALGAAGEDRKIDFTVDGESGKKVAFLLGREGIQPSDILIGIHPGGKPSHRWPAENFARVVAELSKIGKTKFLITGDTHEIKLADKIIHQSGVRAVNLAGTLSLKELGALVQQCRLYICNDTGTMHIAAVVGVPLVAIFGPGYFTRYNPAVISQKAVSLYTKADCAPCNKFDCDSMQCFERITPQDVIRAAVSLLEQEGLAA